MAKKIIYAVNCGEYSDYRVSALFSSRERAEEFMRVVPDPEYNEIEEFQLDSPAASLIRRGYSAWAVIMLRGGDVERVTRTDNGLYVVASAPRYYIWRRRTAAAYAGKDVPDALDAAVWAKSEVAAIKIVNEHRLRMIVDGEWKASHV